jgi:hypothetical protein
MADWRGEASLGITSCRWCEAMMHIALGLLAENRIDAVRILKMLLSRGGWTFLLNRREEILGVLLSRQPYADYHKQ